VRIGLNLLYLIPGVVGGTQTYATGLLGGLAEIDDEDEFVVYLSREAAEIELPKATNFRRVVCPVNAIHRGARYAWEQFMLPRRIRKDRIDLLHSLAYVGPVSAHCPHVVTIHDMNYMDIPDSVPGIRQRALRTLVKRVARNAAHVITMSEFSKQRIVHHLALNPSKITVTHLAGRDHADLHTREDSADLQTRYGITQPYIVAFSSPFRHKNIVGLLEAFAGIRSQVPHDLVLVGHLTPEGEVQRSIETYGLASRVHATGYVPDSDVLPIIRGASLFVFPSFYEGFGLPLLDAQALGVPVAASTAGSIPEVAGGAALTFDPSDATVMGQTVLRVLTEPKLADELRSLGIANAKRFSWTATAGRTREVYDRVVRP
jgi:glycosyltransferase involved in cell wall biosynthesis